jgi:hypothetical protein
MGGSDLPTIHLRSKVQLQTNMAAVDPIRSEREISSEVERPTHSPPHRLSMAGVRTIRLRLRDRRRTPILLEDRPPVIPSQMPDHEDSVVPPATANSNLVDLHKDLADLSRASVALWVDMVNHLVNSVDRRVDLEALPVDSVDRALDLEGRPEDLVDRAEGLVDRAEALVDPVVALERLRLHKADSAVRHRLSRCRRLRQKWTHSLRSILSRGKLWPPFVMCRNPDSVLGEKNRDC